MRVDLVDWTGKDHPNRWYGAAKLIWAKNTRIEMRADGIEEVLTWPEVKLVDELQYIVNTLPSAWEHVWFTFVITGVTRAFTHQLVRTRNASYSQQAMQVLRMDKQDWAYHVGMTIQRNPEASAIYKETMDYIKRQHRRLMSIDGVHTEDARGILPTNIETNIVMTANLRALCDLLRKRASPRNQGARPGDEGEWAVVHREMKARMVEKMPWTDLFLNRTADRFAADAYMLLEGVEDKKLRVDITKRIDAILTNVGSGN
jgi:flavin-dependent thymidylate synthase